MRIMVICAHPHLNESRANRALSLALKEHSDVLFRDLYREYPDWSIQAEREQSLLLEHDRIVLQFPFYWYSCPPLLKKWFDDVLMSGWAYGPGGDHLKGKEFMIATTAGGTNASYRSGGDNFFTVDELLRPIQRTLTRCSGIFLPPFVVYNANRIADTDLAQEAKLYADYIREPARVLVH